MASYADNENLMVKVLDFVQFGGPIGGTVFALWLGGL